MSGSVGLPVLWPQAPRRFAIEPRLVAFDSHTLAIALEASIPLSGRTEIKGNTVALHVPPELSANLAGLMRCELEHAPFPQEGVFCVIDL